MKSHIKYLQKSQVSVDDFSGNDRPWFSSKLTWKLTEANVCLTKAARLLLTAHKWMVSKAALCATTWCLDYLKSPRTALRTTVGLCVLDLLPLCTLYMCTAWFVFICQFSLTYDALVLADNILFKQIWRLKARLSKATIKLALGSFECIADDKLRAAVVLHCVPAFSPGLLYLFKNSAHKKVSPKRYYY